MFYHICSIDILIFINNVNSNRFLIVFWISFSESNFDKFILSAEAYENALFKLLIL